MLKNLTHPAVIGVAALLLGASFGDKIPVFNTVAATIRKKSGVL